MVQPHKGERIMVMPQVPAEIRDWAQTTAARAGVSTSAFIADVMAVAIGRLDLVREMDLGELPAVSLVVPKRINEVFDGSVPMTASRIAKPVVDHIRRRATEDGVGSKTTDYVACTLAAAVGAPLLRDVDDFAAQTPEDQRPVQEALLAM